MCKEKSHRKAKVGKVDGTAANVISLLVSFFPVSSRLACFIWEECTLSSIGVSEKVSEQKAELSLTKIGLHRGFTCSGIC